MLLSLVFAALRALPGEQDGLGVLLFLSLSLLATCLLILLYRWIFSRLLWKVRNRLVVTYLLIGLAPVVLFVTLAGIAAYVFSGQFATFAATAEMHDELERLSIENRAFAEHIAHRLVSNPRATAVQLTAPEDGLQEAKGTEDLAVEAWDLGTPLLLERDVSRPAARKGHFPLPSWIQSGFRGVVADGAALFLRSAETHQLGGHTVTVVSSVPLGPAGLEKLASGLGTVSILPGFSLRDSEPADTSTAAPNAPRLSQNAEAEVGRFASLSGGTLPPAAFLLDTRVFFTAPLETVDWATGKHTSSLMNVSSRPSLLYRRLFGTSVELGAVIRDALIGIAIFFAVLELIALFMAARLSRTITRSVADLYRATVAIDRGNFAHRIQVTRKDQLAALSTSFNTMSESLERLLEQQREKERIQNELAIAQEVQNNLFPQGDIAVRSLELHGICKPARTVSGDYYDFLLMGHTDLCLAMGDISGKGISAALLMASLHSAVRAYRFADEAQPATPQQGGTNGSITASPGKMLSLLNQHLYRSTQPEKYATLFLAYYSPDTRRLTYSNGGQLPPLVLCANGSVKRLDCGGTVVGLMDGMEYEQATVTLDSGDILIAYSDGVTEPENEFGEFGENRMIDIIQRNRHLPLQSICHQTLQELRAWIGDQEQPDDITLVLARQL